MKPLSPTRRRIYFIVFAVLFVVAVPIVITYAVGYRLDFVESLILTERGGIYVYTPLAGVDIYVDDEKKLKTGLFSREYFTQNLKPGRYFIKAEHPDFLSWGKYVQVNAQRVASLYPFFVPKDFVATEIPELVDDSSEATTTPELIKNESYTIYMELFDEKVDPEEEIIKRTFGNTEVWYEEYRLYAKWLGRGDWIPAYFCQNEHCINPSIFLELNSKLTHFEFYPGRDDVVIFSAEDGGVYVVEIDTRPEQTISTIYQSDNLVDFRVYDRDILVIKDNDKIITVNLEI
ncbi:MAG: hypothetical protein MRY49_01385 [Candidatus Pacebacteria bacterium]|nr:hypothetical protein [Candidatus Paceibacterota bacterium]